MIPAWRVGWRGRDGQGVRPGITFRGEEESMATTMTGTRSRAEVEQDMRETLGIVPSFFNRFPDRFLDQEWTLFKELELGETLIPNKYKELIGVAVHSETKCRYCTLFHTEAAKLFGATDEEIQEAVHFAKFTVGWSVYLNGIQEDYDQFSDELQEIGRHLSGQA
jgi:AhpD family alkylhydroperoxidase